MTTPLPISGYVLAGGRSSRMGTDKSLLELAGKPLIAHAVAKLSRICSSVHILSSNPAHAAFAPLVADLHPHCGPVGGIEAGLAHTSRAWNLILPVDVPFLPAAILQAWAASTIRPAAASMAETPVRVAIFAAEGRPQPAISLLHRDIAPSIAAAVALGELELLPVLEASAEVLALQSDQPIGELLSIAPAPNPDSAALTSAQLAARLLWFANLNTSKDLAIASKHSDALDT